MDCCWEELLHLLPPWLRQVVDQRGRGQPFGELRLRLGHRPCAMGWTEIWHWTDRTVSSGDLTFVIHAASQYSLYGAQTIAQGYLTAPGGHRIGLGGEYTQTQTSGRNIKHLRSLCIRVARDVPGIAQELSHQIKGKNLLILGKPGAGKTTLLRDLIRCLSRQGFQISVIDQRQELFPGTVGGFAFDPGPCTDVFSGVDKAVGIQMAVRAMAPDYVAVDEITSLEDCRTMEACAYSGVCYLATAHGRDLEDLRKRPVYRRLLETELFSRAVVLKGRGEFTVEELKSK